MRIDSTVTETDILEPSDSRLLYDGVHVLTRLLYEARERLPQVSVHDHCRAAKRREQEIRSARGEQRRAATYQRLLSLVAHTIAYAEAALAEVCCVTEPWAESWCTEVGACRDLLKRVVEQTERRVFDGETVPASEKVVSLFRAAYRHHLQGRAPDALRPQDQPEHRAQCAGARCGGGVRQPGR